MADVSRIIIKELWAEQPSSINIILKQTWLLFLPGAKRTCASAGQALLNDLLEAGVLGLRHMKPDAKATKDPEQERTTFRIFDRRTKIVIVAEAADDENRNICWIRHQTSKQKRFGSS